MKGHVSRSSASPYVCPLVQLSVLCSIYRRMRQNKTLRRDFISREISIRMLVCHIKTKLIIINSFELKLSYIDCRVLKLSLIDWNDFGFAMFCCVLFIVLYHLWWIKLYIYKEDQPFFKLHFSRRISITPAVEILGTLGDEAGIQELT